MWRIFRQNDGAPLDCVQEIRDDGSIITIRFTGAIDASTIPLIERNFLDKEKEYLEKHLLLDFKDVTHVDSATIAALVLLLVDRKKTHAKIALVNLPEMLKSYLKIEHIDASVPVYESEAEARAALTD